MDGIISSLLAAESHAYFRTFMIASVAGVYSLFPLLFTPAGLCNPSMWRVIECSLGAQNHLSRFYIPLYGRYLSLNLSTRGSIGRHTAEAMFISLLTHVYSRFPSTLPMVILDVVEKVYLAGFGLLQLFITVFPLLTTSPPAGQAQAACIDPEGRPCSGDAAIASPETSGLQFLPLMLTSVYCAVGLVWAFVRLSVLYLRMGGAETGQ